LRGDGEAAQYDRTGRHEEYVPVHRSLLSRSSGATAVLPQFTGSDIPRNAFAGYAASSAVVAQKPRPRISSGPRGRAGVPHDHCGPSLADGLDVETDLHGFVVGTKGQKAAGLHGSATL
jgi:hypothetical protein